MRKIALMLALVFLLGGCAGRGGNAAPGPARPPDAAEEARSAGAESAQALTEDEREQLAQGLEQLGAAGALSATWDGQTPPDGENRAAMEIEILSAARDGDAIRAEAELYDYVLLDRETLRDVPPGAEFQPYVMIPVGPEEGAHAGQAPFGRAAARLTLSAGGGVTALSCVYEEYDEPALRYLRARTEALADELAASEKAGLSACDPWLVEVVYRKLLAGRYIASPQDITLWDLENMRALDIYGPDYTFFGEGEEVPEHYVADGSLLRLIPNLRYLECYTPLEDYGVFEEMHGLEALVLDLLFDEEPLRGGIRVGHTDRLCIRNFSKDFALDLSQADTPELELQSWSAGVTDFAGCEGVQKLTVHSTRTDMRLISAEAFPNLEYLEMNISSEMRRVRDFSRLATFGAGVEISLALNYQACNDDTVASLAGVPLTLLVLDPEGGGYPLPGEPDPALVAQIPAEKIVWLSGAGAPDAGGGGPEN